jgi:hypothetical protein
VQGQAQKMTDTALGQSQCDLTPAAIAEFWDYCRDHGLRRVPGMRSFDPLLDCLKDQGVLVAPPVSLAPLKQLMVDYRYWLRADRGLAEATIVRYEKLARRFLHEQGVSDNTSAASVLTGADVVAFLLRESGRVNVGAAKGRGAELRSVLKFLYLRGLTAPPFTTAVPPVAGWRYTSVPKAITANDVQRLLDSCDHSDPAGVCDYPILMLVARVGLRSIEAARLQLDDLDWRAGRIVLRGKASREDVMPLPADVGQALSADSEPPRVSAAVLVGVAVGCRTGRIRVGNSVGDQPPRSTPTSTRRSSPTVARGSGISRRSSAAGEAAGSAVTTSNGSPAASHTQVSTVAGAGNFNLSVRGRG